MPVSVQHPRHDEHRERQVGRSGHRCCGRRRGQADGPALQPDRVPWLRRRLRVGPGGVHRSGSGHVPIDAHRAPQREGEQQQRRGVLPQRPARGRVRRGAERDHQGRGVGQHPTATHRAGQCCDRRRPHREHRTEDHQGCARRVQPGEAATGEQLTAVGGPGERRPPVRDQHRGNGEHGTGPREVVDDVDVGVRDRCAQLLPTGRADAGHHEARVERAVAHHDGMADEAAGPESVEGQVTVVHQRVGAQGGEGRIGVGGVTDRADQVHAEDDQGEQPPRSRDGEPARRVVGLGGHRGSLTQRRGPSGEPPGADRSRCGRAPLRSGGGGRRGCR